MAIERINFPGGIEMREGKTLKRQIEEIVKAHLGRAEILPADLYPTMFPYPFTRPFAVRVTPEGNGHLLKYRRVSTSNKPQYYPLLRIPDDRESVAILGREPFIDKKEYRLMFYAYFFHTPGPSPLKSQQ